MLIFHIIAGSLVLLFGLFALTSTKGFGLHKFAGNIFFIAMTALSFTSIYLEYQLGEFPIMGILSLYFVSSSWMTVKRPENSRGLFEIVSFVVITAVATMFYIWGWDIAFNGKTLTGTLPLPGYFILGTFAAFAAVLDLTMILRGGVAGSHRVARHLWRMCIAFLMALLSFLDQDVFPDALVGTGLLWAPVFLLMLMMLYWLCRLPINHWRAKRAA